MDLRANGVQNVYSHQLAKMAGCTAAQVRRDLMAVGSLGTPTRGYDIDKLFERIGDYLDSPQGQNVALVGVGNLGSAILAFFSGRRSKLSIVAAFDNDPEKFARVTHGCQCYSVSELVKTVRKRDIDVGIITVPADQAQSVADLLVKAGIGGILNFAPFTIQVPHDVYLENMDITILLERVAFFARQDRADTGNA